MTASPHYFLTQPSPLGELLIAANGFGITHLLITQNEPSAAVKPDWQRNTSNPLLQQAQAELADYFAGRRKRFTVPLAPQGTDFQKMAWRALLAIPYGETRSYGEQAHSIGQPAAARAVGAANGRNPVGIIIPCHRVIGANGALTGYAGGMAAKRFLLQLEATYAATGGTSLPLFAEVN